MSKFTDIDNNFKIETEIKRDNLKFYDAESEPFRIYGIMRENDKFCRMPEETAKSISGGVHFLYSHTAGGRVRFVTDSAYVAVSAELDVITRNSDFPLSGTAGMDMYADDGKGQIYIGTFTPPMTMENSYESVIDFHGKMLRTVTINLPIYSNTKKLYIGLEEGALLKSAPDYKYEKPIVYYGSSITQGGCASRPGNTYQAIISRKLDCNFLNLGFSGSAKGEETMADYIASLDMKIFVLDYDANAPTLEHLQNTHERMFKIIRSKHPDLPIIILSRPFARLDDKNRKRMMCVRSTYENAMNSGDKNVYFISGADLFEPEVWETATVDNCHPNDSGFVSMAKVIGKVIEEILKK